MLRSSGGYWAFLVDDLEDIALVIHGGFMESVGGVAGAGRSRCMLLRPHSEISSAAVQTGMYSMFVKTLACALRFQASPVVCARVCMFAGGMRACSESRVMALSGSSFSR